MPSLDAEFEELFKDTTQRDPIPAKKDTVVDKFYVERGQRQTHKEEVKQQQNQNHFQKVKTKE